MKPNLLASAVPLLSLLLTPCPLAAEPTASHRHVQSSGSTVRPVVHHDDDQLQGPAQFDRIYISSDGVLLEAQARIPGATLSVNQAGSLTVIPRYRRGNGHGHPRTPANRQLSQLGQTTFDYDYRGRATQIGSSTFSYDYRGRLTQVGTTAIDYGARGKVEEVGNVELTYRRGTLESLSDYSTSSGVAVIIVW